jgi:low affinity Fe/Cu permease
MRYLPNNVKSPMAENWHLFRMFSGVLNTRRILVGVALIWSISGLMFHFSRGWLWLLSTGTSIAVPLMLFLILTSHHRQVRMLSEKLNHLHQDLKTTEQAVLRKLHTKHRNGQSD